MISDPEEVISGPEKEGQGIGWRQEWRVEISDCQDIFQLNIYDLK